MLINPPSPFLIEERVFTPTGILYAASELRGLGVDIELLDLARPNSERNVSLEDITRYEREYLSKAVDASKDFDWVGLGCTSSQFKYAARINDAIKQESQKTKTIIGGAHATLFSGLRRRLISYFDNVYPGVSKDPRELDSLLHSFDPNFASLERFDYVISGNASGVLRSMGGDASRWIKSADPCRDLDNIALPARDLIDMGSYSYHLPHPKTGEKVLTTNIMSQWGCPFNCSFCSGRDDDFYRMVRCRSPGKVIEELDAINDRYGIKGFMFFDDELNIDNARFHALLDLLEERHNSRSYVYRGFVKSEIIVNRSPDTFKRMRKAGFAEACTGVESGSDRILTQIIRKNTTRDINLRAAALARESGIRFKAFTMVGHPDETPEDAERTHSWILEARPDSFDCTVCQPYPGSPNYDFACKDPESGIYFLTNQAIRQKRRSFNHSESIKDAVYFFEKTDFGDPKVETFYKGIPGRYRSNVWTPHLSRDDIVDLRDYIEEDCNRKLR